MAYLWNELDFLINGRFTSLVVSTIDWSPELDAELVVLGEFVRLPSGQHVDVETSFLNSHLPYCRAVVSGRDADDEPWLFVLQAVPSSVVSKACGNQTEPTDVLRDATDAVLEYNNEAQVDLELEWSRDDLIDIYTDAGAPRSAVTTWPTVDLVRGLLAEICNVDLPTVVAGYPTCAYPDLHHVCEDDVFSDVFVRWNSGLLNK